MTAPTQFRPSDQDRVELLDRYSGSAARYTSYPTAAQFTAAVDAADHRVWLGALDPSDSVSIYAHIPLCARLCWYCACNTRAVHRRSTITSYVEALVDELALVEAALPGKLKASAFHLGGGTPNMLEVDDLTTLFAAVRHVFRFQPGLEISAELDPAVLTERWVRAAAYHGLTRASLGVQDLSPEVQAAINRPQPFETIARSVDWLRAAGVASVNFDLIYGLPHQTQARLLSTVDQCLTLRPERIALFGYAHVPWVKSHQKLIPTEALPAPVERLIDSERAAEMILAAGYVRIGMDHFALPDDALTQAAVNGRLHRNFQGYTADQAQTLIGIGASSISRFAQGFVQNVSDELEWRQRVERGELPTARGVKLSAQDRLRGAVIERLMCDLTVDVGAICVAQGFDADALDANLATLAPAIADRVVQVDDRVIRLTDMGRPFIRVVAAAFDASTESPTRYSQAV